MKYGLYIGYQPPKFVYIYNIYNIYIYIIYIYIYIYTYGLYNDIHTDSILYIIYIYIWNLLSFHMDPVPKRGFPTGVLLSAALEMPWLKVCQLDACPKLRASTAEQLLQEMGHLAEQRWPTEMAWEMPCVWWENHGTYAKHIGKYGNILDQIEVLIRIFRINGCLMMF